MCLTPRTDCISSSEMNLSLNSEELIDNCDYINYEGLSTLTEPLQSKLVVLQLNIRGIKNKYNDLIELIKQLNCPDIIILGETWLKHSDSQPEN